MPPTSRQIGQLECRIVDHPDYSDTPSDDLTRNIVVLCHGFGAPGNDLVPIGQQILSATGDRLRGTRFIFPAAPHLVEGMEMYDSRAWWPLNMQKMAEAMESGDFNQLRNSVPDGLDVARDYILELLKIVQEESQVPLSNIFIGGFSQGSMLMTDVALRLPSLCAGLIIFSGTLICQSLWQPLAEARGPLKVLQCHGRQDPVLPFDSAIALKTLLTDAGAQLDFIDFDGVHTIPVEGMQQLVAMVEANA